MKKICQLKGNLSLFLICAILVLCAGFLIIACGAGSSPQQKANDSNETASAVDFSSAATGGPCPIAPCTGSGGGGTDQDGNVSHPIPSIEGSAFTLEAWVKRKTANLNGSIFGIMDSKGGLLYVKDNVPKFVIRRLPVAGDIAEASRTALSGCVTNGVTTTECIVPAITSAGSISSVAAVYTIPGAAQVTSTISSAITVNSASLASTFVPSVTSTVTQIQLSSGTANAVTLAAGLYNAYPTPGVASTTFSANVNAVTDNTNITLESNTWYHIAGVLTAEDQSSGPNNCAVDADSNGSVEGVEVPHLAIYINGVLKNCAGTNGQYADNSGARKFTIASGGIDSFLDVLSGIGTWSAGSFEGIIDEIRAWNYARSSEEILKCMNTELGIGGDCDRGDSRLMGYYRFNEGKGKALTDESGNGFSGAFEYTAAPEDFRIYEDGWVVPGAPISQAD